jgi:hypothetical protein
MNTVLAWMLAAMAVYYLFRAIALDNRLWGKRRGGASRWNIWIPPLRAQDFSQTEAGAHGRRASRRAMGFAVLFGLLALAVSSL